MTQEHFLARLKELHDGCHAISVAKNADYANKDDALQNFHVAEVFGIPAEKAILVRMSDKMSRISNLISRPAAVTDESVLDTLSDLANYALILRIVLEQKTV